MKVSFAWTTATGAMAVAMLAPGSASGQTYEPIVELPAAIDMDVSAWTVDRADVASFVNTDWEGREDVIRISITPPAEPTSFYNWQGYSQLLDTPAGSSSIRADMWIGSDWATGTDTDYVRTGIWGSVQPEGLDSYTDPQAIFPIISFTNEDGEARLQVWDTTANPTTGWSDLTASESALNPDSWNSFEMRVLLEADRIDYIVNGVTIYSWDMPRGAEDNISDELWAVYLNGRNNGVTSFDTYWSELAEAQLVLDGETLTAAPDGFNILADATGGISIADGVSVGSIHSSSGSTVSLAFGEDSSVATTGDAEVGVVSDEGGSVALEGGTVTTNGASAHGLYATGAGSEIATDGTAIAVTGAGSFGAYATEGGTIALNGGSVSSSRAALVADGGTIETTDTALSTTVAADNGNDVGVVTTLDGGSANLSGGSITLSGGRMAGLLALSEGTITAENVTISASGDRARGVYANADDNGGGSVTISGGSIETDGLLSHGLFAKRQSGTVADTVASITASDIEISVDGTSANGIYADVGSNIIVDNVTVTTAGEAGMGLHAQGLDDGLSGEGSIAATDVDVTTSGDFAYGGYAELGGELTLTGGSITTSGSEAHGLVAVGTEDYLSQITATDVSIVTSADNAVGIGIAGTGTIDFTNGSIASGNAAIGVEAQPDGVATFNIAGSTLSSDIGAVLDVDRDDGDDGTGIVSLTLSNGTTATGDVLDTGTKTTGYTDLALDNAALTGTVDGVRTFTLTDGATWNATGAGSIDEVSIGTGGGSIDIGAGTTVALSGALTGSGDLSKGGDGTLTLSGDGSAFTGTTTLDSGQILLTGSLAGDVTINEGGTFFLFGNDEVAGDLTGSTVNNGSLIFIRFDDYDYTGDLSGSGNLVKDGTGTLTLSGDISYTGSTISEGGTIALEGRAFNSDQTALIASGGTIEATDVSVVTTADDAMGIGIAGTGTIDFTDGSIASGDAAIGVEAQPDGVATFNIAGSTLSSGMGTILDVDRELDDGTGIVSLTLADGSVATGDILDTGTKTTGYTDLALDNAALTGTVDGVRTFTLTDGATWNATGAGSIDEVSIGTGGGSIDIGAGTTVALSGALTGSGDLSKGGNGTLTLSGDGSAYAGTATIDTGLVLLTGSLAGDVIIDADGTFQIGNNGETGDLTGSTVNNGTLIFARSDDYDYTGALSGNGDLIKRGDGTLLLSGAYTYTGSTVVEGGFIRLASVLDPGTDLVVDSGTFDLSGKTQEVSGLSGAGGTVALGDTSSLTVNQDEDTTYGGIITGTGEFTKTGGGSLNLTGDSTFSGTANVNGGSLAVNGVFPAHFIVNSGGTLHGNGTTGSVTAVDGGTVAPGNSIGTLHVAGDVSFGAGSIYEVEVDADGNNDAIVATGTANLEGGIVSVIAAAGNYGWTSEYTILTAEGGVTGTFADTDVDLPFLDAYLLYGTNEVVLELVRNDLSFAEAAVTANQFSVATALDAGDPASDLYRAIAAQADMADVQQAFDALSGEAWASVGTVLIDQSRRTGELVLGRLQQADGAIRMPATGGVSMETHGRNTAIWGQFTGSWNRIDGDGNAANLKQDSHGFITGIDMALGALRLGAAFSYGEADSDVGNRNSETEAKTTSLAIYTGGGWGNLRLHLGASYAWHDVDGQRTVSFAGFSDEVSGDYDGKSASIFAEISHGLALGRSQVAPFAGINYVHLKTDAFDETGGDAALAIGGVKRDVTFATLGLRARTDVALSDNTVLAPHLSVAWQHGFGDIEAEASNRLSTGDRFTVAGLPTARNALALQAGFEAHIPSGGTFGLSYVGNIADRWNDHGLKLGFSYSF